MTKFFIAAFAEMTITTSVNVEQSILLFNVSKCQDATSRIWVGNAAGLHMRKERFGKIQKGEYKNEFRKCMLIESGGYVYMSDEFLEDIYQQGYEEHVNYAPAAAGASSALGSILINMMNNYLDEMNEKSR